MALDDRGPRRPRLPQRLRPLLGEGSVGQANQGFLFWRNIIALGASVALFGLFASLGDALRFTVTAPLFQF